MQLRSAKQLPVQSFDADRMHLQEEQHLNGAMEKEWQFNQLGKCLESLSEEQRKTVKMFYLEESSYKIISERCGMDQNKVRSLIQNGRRNLKICIEKEALQILKDDNIE
jgi:RNA polymerase sigma factor (sigma-70 family)